MKITKQEKKTIITLIFGVLAFAFLSAPVNNILDKIFPSDFTRIIMGLFFILIFFFIIDGGKWMVSKTTKAMLLIFLIDSLSNLLLLAFYKIPINQQTIIGSVVFTLLLTLILNKSGVFDG